MNENAPKTHPFQPAEAPGLILASASTIRCRLMEDAGLLFQVQASAVDEESIKQASQAEAVPPGETALVLAELKASRVRVPGALVIGADQILTCGDRWLDKPCNRDDAREQLRFLRGKTHTLHTAVTCMRDGQVIWHRVETSHLTMRVFSDEFLETYLDEEIPVILSSVGAYRLEGPGVLLFDKISGDHTSILGLPLLALMGFLRQHGAVGK